MRKLMWFTLGFAGACGLWAYGQERLWLFAAAILLVAAALAGICIARQKRLLKPALALLIGVISGLVWFGGYRLLYLEPLELLHGMSVPLSVTASDYSYETGYRSSVDGWTVMDGKPYQIRAYYNMEEALSPGDTLSGHFRLRLTTGEANSYFQGKGVYLLAYQQGDLTLSAASETPKWCLPAVLRHQILNILNEIFPADTASFVNALLLGESRGLDYETDTALAVSGIRHVVAVSGLHVSILYGLICTLTMKRRYLTALVGMPALLVFAAVAGFSPSVVRACIMVGLMMLSMVVDREYDPPTALAFAVLVMLLVNPLAVTSVSLQLSAGCVAGILLFNSSISHWLSGLLPRKKGLSAKFQSIFCTSISVTLSSMSLITPLAACYFGAVSLVSPLTNLLTLWAVNLVFNGLIMDCMLYLLSPALAGILARGLSWMVRYVVGTAKGLASFPLAAVYTKSIYIVCWLVFAYVLLAAFAHRRKKRPAEFLCCLILSLCLALTASWLEPLTADTQITMLDVGQGQSILLQNQGRTFLVDCGGEDLEETADTVAETLLSQGISRLDGIILTHYDSDHAGAVGYLLTRVKTDILFLPDTRTDFRPPAGAGEAVYVWEDMELTFGSARLQIYGPVYSGPDNENSLCVLFDTEKCDILITGDRTGFGERMLLRHTELPEVDILVAGHHGDREATTDDLLDRVRPDMVLISVGQDNLYGHPAPELLQRLNQHGCTVLRTDEQGTIIIRR